MPSADVVDPWENTRFPMPDSQMIAGNQILLYLMEES